MSRKLELLGAHDVRRFRCGEHALDLYLRKHAAPNATRGVGRTFVLLRADDDPSEWPQVLGYFTLSMAELPSAVAKTIIGDDLPAYAIPVALIGRLARDERARGGGIGEILLGEALRQVVAASKLVACVGVVTDAKNESALAFYERYGFVPTSQDGFPRRCLLPLSTLAAAAEP